MTMHLSTYLSKIDRIPPPPEPVDCTDFEMVRILVRRHVLSERSPSMGHRDLEDAVERRRAAAAGETQRAYSALLSALAHYCSVACTRP